MYGMKMIITRVISFKILNMEWESCTITMSLCTMVYGIMVKRPLILIEPEEYTTRQ
jgi:hypothetical protein